MRGIIDRIEGGLAVCEMDGKIMKNIPVSSFTGTPRSGDVFEYDNETAKLLPKETEERTKMVQSLFEKLKKR